MVAGVCGVLTQAVVMRLLERYLGEFNIVIFSKNLSHEAAAVIPSALFNDSLRMRLPRPASGFVMCYREGYSKLWPILWTRPIQQTFQRSCELRTEDAAMVRCSMDTHKIPTTTMQTLA